MPTSKQRRSKSAQGTYEVFGRHDGLLEASAGAATLAGAVSSDASPVGLRGLSRWGDVGETRWIAWYDDVDGRGRLARLLL